MPSQMTFPSPTGERPRLLLVEDNPSTLMLQRLMLRDDFEVTAATGFDEAIEVFRQGECEVALLDIDLGEERSGVDLLRALREVPGADKLVAVACTAYALPDSRRKFLSAGFNEYIGKPFSKSHLVQTIKSALKREAFEGRPQHLQKIELKVPPPPATFPEIVRMLARTEPVPDTKRLIQVLERDPLTVFWVLRHLNSAYYALRRKVGEIDRAVAMLGHDPICNLVLTEVVTQTFQQFDTEFARAVHRHVFLTSVATGYIARSVAYELEIERPELAFSIGLLHQLGRMALLSSDADGYCKLWKERTIGDEIVSPTREREAEDYDQDYARIGADVARAWKLPEDIIEVIRYHRDARWAGSRRARTLALLVCVGHLASLRMYEKAPEDVMLERAEAYAGIVDDLADLLRIDAELIHQAVASSEEKTREFVAVFASEQEKRRITPADA